MFLQFWQPKSTANFSWFVNAQWVCWQSMGKLSFWIWSLCFWNMSFFVFILDAIFSGANFFIFQDTVWLVKSSWWAHFRSIHQFYWLSDRCRSGFALVVFLSEKSCRHKLVVSTSFWSWLLNVSSVLTSLKYTAAIFWVVNAFGVWWQFRGVLSFWFCSFCF